jgi:hypothetical protein
MRDDTVLDAVRQSSLVVAGNGATPSVMPQTSMYRSPKMPLTKERVPVNAQRP